MYFAARAKKLPHALVLTAVLAGAVILGEAMGLREIIGCVLMFAAIVVAQLPSKEPDAEIGKQV